MTETDKLLVRIGTARDAISRKTEQTSLDYMIDGVLMNCSVLLKEQDNCENCAIAIEDRQPVVRCRDCVHQYYDLKDGRIVCGNVDDGEIHPADWYCADGERRTDNA